MGLLGSLFGGSKSTSVSENVNNEFLKGKLGGAIDSGTGAINSLSSMLSGGFGDYLKNAGFDSVLSDRLRGVTGSSAAKGLLRSGAAGNAFINTEMDTRKGFFDNYLGKLSGVAQLGLGAANTIAGSGQRGTSTGKSNGGIIPGLFG